MSEKINWSISARVNGGPMTSASGTVEADAYDKIAITLAAQESKTVEIAPQSWKEVSFLAVNPQKASDKLTYKANGADVPLDGPLFLLGAGAVSLLGSGDVELEMKNATDAEAVIDILVGRKAI